MPSIKIIEIDNTKLQLLPNENFSVVVPVFIKEDKYFDENGIFECTNSTDNLKKFNEAIYYTSEIEYIGTGAESGKTFNFYGNKVAKQLLDLGYTVLLKKINVLDSHEQRTTDLEKLKNYDEFWKLLEDKSLYDFRYIITGLLEERTVDNIQRAVNKQIGKLAKVRKDCIALCDIQPECYQNKASQEEIINGITANIKEYYDFDVDGITPLKDQYMTRYAAFIAPEVVYNEYGKFPGSFHYLACAAKAKENSFAEWYAVAGYTRGVSRYTISSVGCKLGEAAINALELRNHINSTDIWGAVNLIVRIRNNYYLWGNRTAEILEQGINGQLLASHFLNIRQLCCTLKKRIYDACRQFTFDPNSEVLWVNFVSAISPLLDKMKADQGISDYKINKVKTDKKAVLQAQVRIVPIEAVEDFVINVSLENDLAGDIEFEEEEK